MARFNEMVVLLATKLPLGVICCQRIAALSDCFIWTPTLEPSKDCDCPRAMGRKGEFAAGKTSLSAVEGLNGDNLHYKGVSTELPPLQGLPHEGQG
jgi:hypothetical protein